MGSLVMLNERPFSQSMFGFLQKKLPLSLGIFSQCLATERVWGRLSECSKKLGRAEGREGQMSGRKVLPLENKPAELGVEPNVPSFLHFAVANSGKGPSTGNFMSSPFLSVFGLDSRLASAALHVVTICCCCQLLCYLEWQRSLWCTQTSQLCRWPITVLT